MLLLWAGIIGQVSLEPTQGEPLGLREGPGSLGGAVHLTELAQWDPQKGLRVPLEVVRTFSLQFCPVRKGTVTPKVSFEAQIYRLASEEPQVEPKSMKGSAWATAFVDPKVASELPKDLEVRAVPKTKKEGVSEKVFVGRLVRVDDTVLPAIGKVETLFALRDPGEVLSVGDWVVIQGEGAERWSGLVIPRGALLRTTQGPFVYVQRGDYLQRVAVTPVCEDPQAVGIKGEVKEGEAVVCHGAESLWLLELSLKQSNSKGREFPSRVV
ncbi:efflux RND transporter periplasmic adaptor subunit [Candidatus Methylacidithermus pantelleriae]|uniref:Uncharacterized protein n=1 Tax=Candidatus Methylacidithermus pantelleriae TaxID=2744239 RepID=A0A8J2BLN9_9BACT|nr:efflux RND transporter periplasmic adaptor subunit [Candidatus Methylacidithermus pantelleriae]CAF0700042.1 hypothetical protein MPNT_320020 [Candidatus Methylacidithermus pantelleriae]